MNDQTTFLFADTGDWGLTYDDGPSSFHGIDDSTVLVAALKEQGIKCTHFRVGVNALAESGQKVLKAAFDEGHEVANHTWTHHPLTTMTNVEIVAQIKYTEAMIYKVTGAVPTLIRPPYGDVDDRVRAIMSALGYRNVMWTTDPMRDTRDWAATDGNLQDEVVTKTVKEYFPEQRGFISLQHDAFAYEVQIATRIIARMKTGELEMKPKPVGQCTGIPPYRDLS
ncbi:hypothetical protein PhCBS80983_g05386 [Powellomyces hirtus]|uniref:NodB homology domain-containing protein n=1 Tax=Powellomyces hirtus TaxID=109895 RepID=A0A507DWW0_9FUNG|nr:hypothetical protein PhCBS80983_g05386 [Powellomyces hirtus]